MQLQPGDRIGEYVVRDLIGDGGFSLVYLAEDVQLQRLVAIKQLRAEAFAEDGSREWFMREARLTASLNHPNIVQIYSLRDEGDSLFLIMEYLPGDLLSLVHERGPLDRALLLRVAADICRALETLHARGVIHRDIKPENILIGANQQFKLADFGLAHANQVFLDSHDASSGPQPGTLLYMSPEQALGLEVTPQSDLYALAVVLYEAITGHYYLDYDEAGGDEETLTALIAHADPLPLRPHHPSIPPEVEGPLAAALSKDPAARPAAARDFAAALREVLARGNGRRPSSQPRPAPARAHDLAPELAPVRILRDAQGQPQRAQSRLRPLWERYRHVPEVVAEWGETLLALGETARGRDLLEEAVRARPDLPFAQLALAEVYHAAGEFDSAVAALHAALRADPDLVFAALYDEMSASLDDPAAFADFVELFQTAADKAPSAALLHNLGQVLALDKNRAAESAAAYEAAIELDPAYGPPYVGLGSLLSEQGRADEAIAVLEQAVHGAFPALPPGEWHKVQTVYQRQHAYIALAVTYAQVGQFEPSVGAARSALDLAPLDLEEDAPALLDAYALAAQHWLRGGPSRRAYRFLEQVMPLAATWGDERFFSLLQAAELAVSAATRRPQIWADALDWLAAAAH